MFDKKRMIYVLDRDEEDIDMLIKCAHKSVHSKIKVVKFIRPNYIEYQITSNERAFNAINIAWMAIQEAKRNKEERAEN